MSQYTLIPLYDANGVLLGNIHPGLSRKLTRTRKAAARSKSPYEIQLLPGVPLDSLAIRFR